MHLLSQCFKPWVLVWSQESNMHSYDPAGQHPVNRAYLPTVSACRTVTKSWLLELLQGSYNKQNYHWCEKDVIILMPWLLPETKKSWDPDRIWAVWTMTSHVLTPCKYFIHSVLRGLEVWILSETQDIFICPISSSHTHSNNSYIFLINYQVENISLHTTINTFAEPVESNWRSCDLSRDILRVRGWILIYSIRN